MIEGISIDILNEEEYFKLSEYIDNILITLVKNNSPIYNELNEEMKFNLFSEAISGTVKRATKKAAYNVRKVDKKVSKTVDDTVDAAIDGNKKNEIKSIREDILRGRGKVSTLIKRIIKTAAIGVAIDPVLGLIAFLFSTLRRKKLSEQERNRVLFEMRQELEIVEEKIRDAESDGNKKLKYNYMRIRTELKRNIDQLRYNGVIANRDVTKKTS